MTSWLAAHWLTVATHLLVAAASSLLTLTIVRRATGAPDPHLPHPHLPTGRPDAVRRRPSITLMAILLLAAVIVVYGLAQQGESKRRDASDARQRHCFVRVVDELADATTKRSDANAALQRAATRKSKALDQIVNVVILGRQTPPQATARDFDRALREYTVAKAALQDAQREFDKVRLENPTKPNVKEQCS